MKPFLDTADSRCTDQEIISAIWYISGENESEAVRIWESPKDEEIIAIAEIVTLNHRFPTTSLCWGTAGYTWY